jgi:hypothetical protein
MAAIHRDAFPRQMESETWVCATLAAEPRVLTYVVVQGGAIAGYIFWAQKSGIRSNAVVELDQIAICAELRVKGLGELLIRESLSCVTEDLAASGQTVKSIMVSTRADSQAQRLYAKALGVQVVAEIKDLYSATEVFMLAESAVPNNSFRPKPLRGSA